MEQRPGLHDHPTVPSDDAVVARHRAHQGRWRSDELGLPPGPGGRRRADGTLALVDSMLDAEHGGRNLMSEAAVGYARERVRAVQALNGTVETDRLWRNLLSSQPLAFSVAGELRAYPKAAAAVLATLTGRPVTGFTTLDADDPYRLEGLQAEWAPDPAVALGDRSAADLAAALTLSDGRRLLVTVEVKYTEPFSRAPLRPNPRYDAALTSVGLTRADADRLHPGCTQFLRSVLLTRTVADRGACDEVLAVVLGREDDRRARAVVDTVGTEQKAVPVAYRSFPDLFGTCATHPELADWSTRMSRRYCPSGARV